MIKKMTSLIIIFSMILVSSETTLAYEGRKPFDKLREKRFWRKLDRQIARFQKSVTKLEKLDDKKLERRIKRLSKKSHNIIESITPEDIKNNIPYFKSEQFKSDIKERINQEINKYHSFGHFYEQTMNGARRTLCMMGKIGIWTTAPVLLGGSFLLGFAVMMAAAYIDPGLGWGLIAATTTGMLSGMGALGLTGQYRCLPRK